MGMASFLHFFCNPKFAEKLTPQKSFLGGHFLIFLIFQSRFFSIFSYSGTPLVVIFGHFAGLNFFAVFLSNFPSFLEKSKNEKTRWTRKIHIIVKVASLQKRREGIKQTMETTSIFYRKLG